MRNAEQSICGMRLMPSELAVYQEPVRSHAAGRHGEAYHQRIQKKWKKRFGMRDVPTLFLINTDYLGLGLGGPGERVVLAHPKIIERIKREIDSGGSPRSVMAQQMAQGGGKNG